jgi:hypothetical protein
VVQQLGEIRVFLTAVGICVYTCETMLEMVDGPEMNAIPATLSQESQVQR